MAHQYTIDEVRLARVGSGHYRYGTGPAAINVQRTDTPEGPGWRVVQSHDVLGCDAAVGTLFEARTLIAAHLTDQAAEVERQRPQRERDGYVRALVGRIARQHQIVEDTLSKWSTDHERLSYHLEWSRGLFDTVARREVDQEVLHALRAGRPISAVRAYYLDRVLRGASDGGSSTPMKEYLERCLLKEYARIVEDLGDLEDGPLSAAAWVGE